jgi:nicotinate-nucleotide adenylyltransferase
MVDRGTGAIRDLHNTRAGRIYVRAVTQLEISSTELRQLIVAGEDPRYLVPEEVRAMVRASTCYYVPDRKT